jgi:hypothetical protein
LLKLHSNALDSNSLGHTAIVLLSACRASPELGTDHTRPKLSGEDKNGAYSLTTSSGEEHQFAGIVDVARWATATAFEY